MRASRPSICARCDRTAILGWGTPPEWLCFTHYEDELKKIASIIRTGSKILQADRG